MPNVQDPSRARSAILVGLYDTDDALTPEDRLAELAALVRAAEGTVVDATWQPSRSRGRPRDVATLIGQGKVAEVRERIETHAAGLVVFDNELSAPQIRELETGLGCRVIDRSELILDLFARRARTREARLQVELAQLRYTAPRLRGMWTHLERQAGGAAGIGQRGPGEKQIEIDRRIVGRQITRLSDELREISRHRERRRERRSEDTFRVGLVGYTNAGKSTLLNTLTGAGTYAADALFATLDTCTRRWRIDGSEGVVISDTVGFVRDLPHHLVASFRATLEESLEADLLLHVIDASHPHAVTQMITVEEVLRSLDRDPSEAVRVLNKMDAVQDPTTLAALRDTNAEVVEISARTGDGLDALADLVRRRWQADWVPVRVTAEATAGRVRALAHASGRVDEEGYEDGRWQARVRLPRRAVGSLTQAGGLVTEG